jgi:glycosyltransferase involved in cell wall biosynthesis
MSGVHQFVPMLHVGDAVGQHALALRTLLRDRGLDSEIYVEREDPDTAHETLLAGSFGDRASGDDVVVYQLATESDLVPWLADRTERLVVNYHNVTPPELFARWNNPLARAQVRAQSQVRELARRAALGVAVSEFNRIDLRDAGFEATAVVPPIIPMGSGLASPLDGDPNDSSGRGERGSAWLVVGRIAPNKALEDVIDALFLHRRHFDPGATLTAIGKPAIASYVRALADHVASLGLEDAVRFSGRVDDEVLAQAYDRADVLMVASEHEGFCLPVVEAMLHDLPVVAYRRGALPEVLGQAGVLVDRADPWSLAVAAHRLTTDQPARKAAIEAGRRRLPELRLPEAGPRLVDLLLAVRTNRPLTSELLGSTWSASPTA